MELVIDDEMEDNDDYETKIALQTFELIHYTYFLPILDIKDDDSENSNVYSNKTYYMLEKVKAINPKTQMTEQVLLLSDTGCRKTVGNQIEHLDHFEQETRTNIVLSSLNGIDSVKRVCRIHA